MMFELTQTSQFWLYFLLVAGIVVLPGMDMAFVMASALVDGRRAGAAAVAGIVAGGLIHVAMGTLGVGLVLLSAPRLFNGLLLAGSLYMTWMGVSLLRGASALGSVREEASRPLRATWGRALPRGWCMAASRWGRWACAGGCNAMPAPRCCWGA
ncbi:MAG TPA: LysE family transporter [Burkholderiaceae bacterium]|nr:LysE family transporter [Burkholderiaceae bacterium]